MKRADKNTSDKKPLWIKTSPGTLILRSPRRRIKHKQKFRADVEELGNHVDQCELLEGEINKAKYPELDDNLIPPEKEEYSIENLGNGWYNVVSPTGEIMNSKKLRSEDANSLKEELESESE